VAEADGRIIEEEDASDAEDIMHAWAVHCDNQMCTEIIISVYSHSMK
jgi:hypothetical protein